MGLHTVPAIIEVYPDGDTAILYQIGPEDFVEQAEFIQWAQKKEAVFKGEVEKAKTLGKKAQVKAFLKRVIQKRSAPPKVKASSFPLVSKAAYRKNLEMLKLLLKNSQVTLDKQTKPKVVDRPLYKEIETSFVSEGVSSNQKDLLAAFINGLTTVYTKGTKGKIDKSGWSGWTQTDSYQMGALGKYFNIYVSEKGDFSEPWRPKESGYFFGFSE